MVRRDLVQNLQAHPRLRGILLDRPVPPKEGGVNVEAVASDGEGRLWIGFRSPVINGKALAVRIKNPEGVLFEGEPFIFDTVRWMDLGGLGFRDLVRLDERSFLILAGPQDGRRSFDSFVGNLS